MYVCNATVRIYLILFIHLLIGGHLGGVHLSAVEIINATMNMLYKYLSPYYILAIMLVFLVHKSSLHVIYFDLP